MSMNPPLNRALAGLLTLACALLAACGTDAPPAPAQPASAVRASPTPVVAPAAAAPATQPDPKRIAALLAIAQEDFVAGRYVSPPDANALQGYLDVRALDPDNPHVREALVDLYPFAAQKAELALAGGDSAEAARIVALLKLAAPEALGLAELDQRVSAAQAAPVIEGPPEAAPADAPVAGEPAVQAAPGEAPAESTPQQ
jgi:hypothetical protein